MTCPNGGRAFRDRNHSCAFTPCQFIPPAPPNPSPTAIDPSTKNATWWLGNEEFYVPTIRFRDLKRGKRMFKRMLRLMHRKTNDSRSWIQEGLFAASTDIYHVVPEQNTLNRRTDLDTLRAAVGDENASKKVLTVSKKPWSLYELFGCHELQTSEWAVHTALDLLHETLNSSAYQVMNISGARAAMVIGNKTQHNSIPTLVLENDVNISTHSPTWFSQLPVQVQSNLCGSLETLLVRLGLAQVPIENLGDQLPLNGLRPWSRLMIMSAGPAQKSTASVVVFLTSMPQLLPADDAVDAMTVWNFTMRSCDSVVIKSLEAQKNVIYQPSVNASFNSTADAGGAWNSSDPALKTNATTSRYVCSCWMYHDVRDAAALTAHMLTYCH